MRVWHYRVIPLLAAAMTAGLGLMMHAVNKWRRSVDTCDGGSNRDIPPVQIIRYELVDEDGKILPFP